MPKGNKVIPNVHQRKHLQQKWHGQGHVRTWFDQPAAKQRRRNSRLEKAKKIAPRPVAGPLRPAVRSQTVRYNTKLRAGRGFTLQELKAAGVNRSHAQSIGVAVDHRRRNHCQESLQLNAARLKEYLSRVIVIPRRTKKPKKGDATAAQLATVQAIGAMGEYMPVGDGFKKPKAAAITDELRKTSAYSAVRVARSNARLVGIRAKRAKAKAEAAQATAKGGDE
eukprot:c16315_g1_i1.p2 GENE.c16315_g1_i1~~c16315_g1_i1.p2  ORF type:complete len:223 (+),score=41.80 c16315_g1_i1:39-707(+)